MIRVESHRRSLLRALNSRWIYGKIPLLHTIIALFQAASVSLLIQKFNSYYDHKPILTTMITNAILGGIADTVAQSVTAIRQQAKRKASGDAKNDMISIEVVELERDRKNSWPRGDVVTSTRHLPPPFDFERLTRFMSYGFLMAPVQYSWFAFLGACFPMTPSSATVPALKRVAFDQLIFAPISIGVFFTFMTLAEGGSIKDVQQKFQEVYMPALKANYILWPAIQILNFRVMPVQLQLPFVATIGIAWTAYLSLTNAEEEVD